MRRESGVKGRQASERDGGVDAAGVEILPERSRSRLRSEERGREISGETDLGEDNVKRGLLLHPVLNPVAQVELHVLDASPEWISMLLLE